MTQSELEKEIYKTASMGEHAAESMLAYSCLLYTSTLEFYSFSRSSSGFDFITFFCSATIVFFLSCLLYTSRCV